MEPLWLSSTLIFMKGELLCFVIVAGTKQLNILLAYKIEVLNSKGTLPWYFTLCILNSFQVMFTSGNVLQNINSQHL